MLTGSPFARLSTLWDLISGAARRRATRRWRAEWCRVRFDDTAVEITVQERPLWWNRVQWDEITAVGVEPKGMLGPGLYLFITREPGVVWLSLEGEGAPALRNELARRSVPFRPLSDLWRELDQQLLAQARRLIRRDFPPAQWPLVEAVIDAYDGKARGRTQVAIVRLAHGNLQKVHELAAEARRGDASIVSRDILENMSPPASGNSSGAG